MPEILSGIITGCVMSFTLSLDDFIISYFTNGPSYQTLPIYIFSMTKKRVKPDMYALSTLMFISILVLLVLMNIAQSKAEKRVSVRQNEKTVTIILSLILVFVHFPFRHLQIIITLTKKQLNTTKA